jgi:hypothetical protein
VSAGTLLGALLQLVLLTAIGWVIGDAILRRVSDAEEDGIGMPERSLAALAGAIVFCIASMALHIVTGGAVFGVPGVVPALGVVVLLAGRRRLRITKAPSTRVILAAVVLVVLYMTPALAAGSSIRTGDPPWHLGWSQQLLAGEPVPTGPAPEFGRNAYPWGLHAVMATAVRLVPMSTPMVSLEMLHLALLAGLPLGAAVLARRVRPDAGWTAAGAASLIGGFGWISAGRADFITSPSEAAYGADLVVASPNSVYELFPPGLPRELGLVMLAVAAWLLIANVRSERPNRWAVAGAAIGCVGLLSVPLFVTALLWLLIAGAFAPAGRRARWYLTTGASAAAVFGLWAGPVLSQFLRYGGFVNITPQLGEEWPLPVALASWGILLPLAIAGVVLVWRDRDKLMLPAFAASTVVLLGVAVARGRFDWEVAGNATLLHQGRMWPTAHLLGAVFAGVALVAFFAWLRPRGLRLAGGAMAAVFAFGAISPVLAAQSLTDTMRAQRSGFEYGRSDLQPGSFVRRAAAYLGPDDVVEVRDGHKLAFLLFQLSGVKLASYDDPRLERNELRIRYRDLAQSYDETMETGGFTADFMVLPAPDGPYRRALVQGAFEDRDWVLVQLSG